MYWHGFNILTPRPSGHLVLKVCGSEILSFYSLLFKSFVRLDAIICLMSKKLNKQFKKNKFEAKLKVKIKFIQIGGKVQAYFSVCTFWLIEQGGYSQKPFTLIATRTGEYSPIQKVQLY